MPTFSYRAKDKGGATVSGEIEAVDERAAAAAIREAGRLPMDIHPTEYAAGCAQDGPEAGSWLARRFVYPLWTGVNIRALAIFYRQLATLLGSGMSLSEALASVGSRTRGRLGRIVGEAIDNVRSGGALSATMARHPRVFGGLQIGLIRAGESGGLLESMADRIASYLEYELGIRRRIAKITFYPIVVFVFIVLMPHVPVLVLNGGAAFLASLWSSVRLWLPYAVLAIVVLKLLFQFESVRLVWDYIKIQPPILGTMARKTAMSRFGRALAVLYSAGMQISEAVSVSAEACANVAIGRGIRSAVPAIRSGRGLTESLAKTGMIMPMVTDTLSTGEKTGNMDAVLQKAADYMDDEVDATIQKTGVVLFVLMILAAGAVVLRMAIGFYSGYLSGMLDRVP